MKKLALGIALIIAFTLGCVASNLINANRCLVQNITLNNTLSVIDSKNCYITNVNFKDTDIAMVIQ